MTFVNKDLKIKLKRKKKNTHTCSYGFQYPVSVANSLSNFHWPVCSFELFVTRRLGLMIRILHSQRKRTLNYSLFHNPAYTKTWSVPMSNYINFLLWSKFVWLACLIGRGIMRFY